MIPKFRAYLKMNKKIVDVQEINYKYKEIVWLNGKYTEVDNFVDIELLQSTGLFDKNGKEMFEGDIVDCYTEGLSTVEFEHGCFGLVCNGYFEGFVNVLGKTKVIGNIYEHPHLLGED